MEYEEIFLSYNLDSLIDLYESLKSMSLYNGLLDLNVKSSDFVNVITKNIVYVELTHDDDHHSGDENEYYNHET